MLETLLQPNDTVERCGLILKDGTIVETANVSPMPEISYDLDPLIVLKHLEDATATWHTHPEGPHNLSGEDYKGFLLWPNLEHVIITPEGVLRYRVENGAVFECA